MKEIYHYFRVPKRCIRNFQQMLLLHTCKGTGFDCLSCSLYFTTLKLQLINPCGFQSELHLCTRGCEVGVSCACVPYENVRFQMQLQAKI